MYREISVEQKTKQKQNNPPPKKKQNKTTTPKNKQTNKKHEKKPEKKPLKVSDRRRRTGRLQNQRGQINRKNDELFKLKKWRT